MNRVAIAALLIASLLACGEREHVGAWMRHDLWTAKTMAGETKATKVEVPLASESADPAGVEPSRIRGLRVQPGEQLPFHLDLGAEAFFSFIPLRAGAEDCRYHYRVAVESSAGSREVADAVASAGPAAPETVTVSLAEWSGKAIVLRLTAEAKGRCTASAMELPVWGSPAVYWRCRDCQSRVNENAPLNVILISFDAMRADAIGPRGDRPSLTPSIDRFAARSHVWTNAYATFNATNPSFASTMTGFYGPKHGVYDLQTPLPYSFTTLAEILRGAGYRTGAVVSAQHLSDAASGLGQGFEDYIVAPRRYSAEMAADLAMDWLRERQGPFFFWLHFFDPHTPHDAPRPYSDGHRAEAPSGMAPPAKWIPFRMPGAVAYRDPQLRAHEDLYDAEVAYLDRQVDRLLDYLDSRGLLERSVVIVMSDHGENGRDDRVPFRHAGLWDATTHVPLIIHQPDGAAAVHDGFVQNVDLLPTILQLVGQKVPSTDGRSLLNGEPRTMVFSEHSHHSGAMVRDADFLYSWSKGNPFVPDGETLFDVRRDPRQQNNLAATRRDVVAAYREKLRGQHRSMLPAE
jgi:arylsulfatase A-like enzyme